MTIATTNDVRAIEDGANSAARFGRIVEVPGTGRACIWQGCLEGFEGTFDTGDWLTPPGRMGN